MSPSLTSTPPPVLPLIDENLFIPDAIDFNLDNNPEQPFFIFADPQAPNGVGVVTHREFGRAAHRIAHVLRPDRAGVDGQVVAFIALADTILYQAITVGLIVAGFVPFPISPRNSPAAVVNLLEKTSCRRLITTNVTLKPLIDGIKSHIANTPLSEQLQIEEIPSFATAYPHLAHEAAEDSFQRYTAPTKRPSKDDVCVYLHSSGSTGLPKAIPQTHLALINWVLLPGVSDFRDHPTRLIMGCMALPAFHTLGVYMQLLNPVYGIVPISVYPPTATSPELSPITPSPENILEHTKLTGSNSMVIIPTLLQIWSNSAEAVAFLKSLEYIGYSGGSLAPKLGDSLANAGVSLHSVYGGTEFGGPTRMMTRKGDEKEWDYMEFSERVNVRWVPQGDGTFECQFLASEKHQPMVNNLPDADGYSTSDIWATHPTKKHLWKIVGRVDDVIVHSSGEKTVPGPMEDVIMSHPLVRGAIMFGRERDQTGILIELTPGNEIDVNDHVQLAALRNKLWHVVEEANKAGPTFSRIFKEMILVAAKDKPLPRAGKGTVMRKAALNLYDEEITALYETLESSIKGSEDVSPPTSWSPKDIETWIVEQAVDLTSGGNIATSVDLFEQGFDSLSATFLRLRIIGALRSSGDATVQKAARDLNQNLVYSYPVITELAAHIASLYASPGGIQHGGASRGTVLIEDLIAKYTAGFESYPETAWSPRTSPPVVLLTGSTGNLGSQMLAALLQDDRIEKVYAFNRASKGGLTIQERHLERFHDKGLNPDLLDSEKLEFISGDTTQPDLGLDRGGYSQLCRSVNVVIHNAWKLDFNLSLSSFELNIRGTRHLIDLVKSGPHASTARFVFTSSVASAQSWDKSRGPFPEEVITDASVAVGGGYGEGKYVAERILVKSGLQVTSLRIGQVSGGRPKGAWATSDWLPILVKSSVTLKKLPTMEGVVSWLPMDVAAAAVVDIAVDDGILPPAMNLVHPRPVEWRELVTSLRSAIKHVLGRNMELVPFADWFLAVETHAKKATAEILDSIVRRHRSFTGEGVLTWIITACSQTP
ncbi:putative aminoadipate reductase [Lyophyllum atratum]|nr:putative aminoadipate reductase [Lyophyllum atratum]